MDGHGTLKLSNFCLSRLEGETLEEFFTLLPIPDEAGGGEVDDKDNFESNDIRRRLQGQINTVTGCICCANYELYD